MVKYRDASHIQAMAKHAEFRIGTIYFLTIPEKSPCAHEYWRDNNASGNGVGCYKALSGDRLTVI